MRKTNVAMDSSRTSGTMVRCIIAYGDVKKYFEMHQTLVWPYSFEEGAWDYIMLNPNYRAAFPDFAMLKTKQQAKVYRWITSNQNAVHRHLVDTTLPELNISESDWSTTIAIGTRTYIDMKSRGHGYYTASRQSEYINTLVSLVKTLMQEQGLDKETTTIYHATDSSEYRALVRQHLKGLGRYVTHDVPLRAPNPRQVSGETLLGINNGMVDFAALSRAQYAIISSSTFYHAARIPTAFNPAKKTIYFSFLGRGEMVHVHKYPQAPYGSCSKRDRLTCNYPSNWKNAHYRKLQKLGLYN